MRATAATLTLALALMGIAPNRAICQTLCASAEARTGHHAARVTTHHHPSHTARTHDPTSLLRDNSGCKSLVQVSLLRRQVAQGVKRPVATAIAAQGMNPELEVPVSLRDAFRYPDRHGPQVTATSVVPLRV